MRPATTAQCDLAEMTADFLMAYLLTLNQLSEMRLRVEGARNEQERLKSLVQLRNARKRCHVLRSLVFPREPDLQGVAVRFAGCGSKIHLVC
jgi:hypothetical protein